MYFHMSVLKFLEKTFLTEGFSQGRVRLRARWAIAQGPRCQGAQKREKSEKSV